MTTLLVKIILCFLGQKNKKKRERGVHPLYKANAKHMCQIWKVFVKNLLEILKIEKTCVKKSNFQQLEKLENGATLSPQSPWGQLSGAESELLLSGGTKAFNPLCLHSAPSLICYQKTLEFETRKKEITLFGKAKLNLIHMQK